MKRRNFLQTLVLAIAGLVFGKGLSRDQVGTKPGPSEVAESEIQPIADADEAYKMFMQIIDTLPGGELSYENGKMVYIWTFPSTTDKPIGLFSNGHFEWNGDDYQWIDDESS